MRLSTGAEANWLAPDEHLLIAVGERFANVDGASRQDELGRCQVGEAVALQREPSNRRDPKAVAVHSCRGVQVGYLGREDAAWLAPIIDADEPVEAIVARVAPKGRPLSPLAVTIKVRLGR